MNEARAERVHEMQEVECSVDSFQIVYQAARTDSSTAVGIDPYEPLCSTTAITFASVKPGRVASSMPLNL